MDHELKEISAKEFSEDHFDFWRKGLLLTAEADGRANTMTVGWGGVGVMWGKNVVFVVVRPERYTHEFMERSDSFSVCALGDDRGDALRFCGTTSGRERDKISECGLTLLHCSGVPYIGEASVAMICKRLSATPLCADQLSPELEKWYGAHGGYHTLYIGEIEKILA